MKKYSTVLHDLTLQALPRRLHRSKPDSPPPVAAPPAAKTAIAASVAVQRVDPESQPAVAQNAVVAVQQRVAINEIDTSAFASGYQEGYRKAQQEANQEMRRLAEQLAGELAKEAIDQAHAQARQESKGQTDQMLKKLHGQWQQKLTQLDLLLSQLPTQFHAYLADAEDDMLALVYEVVCRIFGEEGASLPGLRAQLQQCMKAWHGHALLSIEMHPDDLALLQNDAESLKLLKTGGFSSERSTLRWVADPKVSVGGCRLRSAEGILDARLEVQFKALEATLVSTRASRKHLAAMRDQAT